MALEKKQIGMQNIKRRLLKGGIWVTGGFIINALAALAIGALLARILSTEDVGLYFLAFSLVISGSTIIQFGMWRTVVRLVAESVTTQQLGRARSVIVKVLIWVAVGGAILSVLLSSNLGNWLASIVFENSKIGNLLPILSIWLSVSALRSIVAESFRGLHNIKMAALGQRILPNIILAGGFVAMWISNYNYDLYDTLLLSAATGTVVFAYTGLKLYRHISVFPRDNKIAMVDILRPSRPLFFSQTMTIIMGQAPIWILGVIQDASELALYGAAARISVIISMPLLISNNVIMPMVASLYSANEHNKLSRLLSMSVSFIAIPATLIFILFFVAGDEVLGFIFGNNYRGADISLTILSIGLLLNVYAGSAAVALAMTGNESRVLRSAFVSMLISLALGGLLIPQWGSVGAAIASSVGLGVYNIILCMHCKIGLNIQTYVGINGFKELYSAIVNKHWRR